MLASLKTVVSSFLLSLVTLGGLCSQHHHIFLSEKSLIYNTKNNTH